jgi:hypothetical protein
MVPITKERAGGSQGLVNSQDLPPYAAERL